MSSVPPCTVIVHVAGDVDHPLSPHLPSRSSSLASFASKTPSRNLLAPPSTRPAYERRSTSLNDYYPYLRPSWTPAPGEDPDSDTITLVPIDSLDFDPDFAPDQPWHRRLRAKAKASSRRARGRGRPLWGRLLFFGAVVAIVVLRGLVFFIKLLCLPLMSQQS